MSTRSKQHHFVPQSILKNFSIDNKREKIFVLDKSNFKIFPNAINKTGSEKFFHSIRFKDSELNFENEFNIPDSKLSQLVTKIVKDESLELLTQEERESLISLTCLQYLRTRDSLNRLIKLSQNLEEIKNLIIENWEVPEKNITPNFSKIFEDQAKIFLLNLNTSVTSMSNNLNDKLVYLLRSNDKNPFYCCDAPVVKNNSIPSGHQGFKDRGIEIYFPISKNITVAFKCKSLVYKGLPNEIIDDPKKSIGEFIKSINFRLVQDSPPDQVKYINQLLVRESNRFVYSNENNFDEAIQLIENNPSYGYIDPTKDKNEFLSDFRTYSNIRNGIFLIIFGQRENHEIQIEQYDLDKLEFKTNQIADVSRIQNDYPIKELKLIEDKKMKLLTRDNKFEWVNKTDGIFKIKYKDKAIFDMLQKLRK